MAVRVSRLARRCATVASFTSKPMYLNTSSMSCDAAAIELRRRTSQRLADIKQFGAMSAAAFIAAALRSEKMALHWVIERRVFSLCEV